MGTALMPVGSTRRVPGASSGALYCRSTPCSRSPADAGTLFRRAPVAANAGAADPAMLDRTGMAARPPRTLRRPSVPLSTPSVSSASACFRLPLVVFIHVPLLPQWGLASRTKTSLGLFGAVSLRADAPGQRGGNYSYLCSLHGNHQDRSSPCMGARSSICLRKCAVILRCVPTRPRCRGRRRAVRRLSAGWGRRDDDGEGGQAGRRLDAVSWMVTRFSSRVAKLCTGPPPVVAFVAGRMVALAGQRHPATGAGRLIPYGRRGGSG